MKINRTIKQKTLLESLMVGADPVTALNLRKMNENFVVPVNKFLAEVALSPEQINQLFTSAEQQATTDGGNRTALGKGADAVSQKVDAIKSKFEKNLPAPDAGPVKDFEQKATDAVGKIEDPKAKQTAMGMIQQGMKNPVVQQLILAGLSGAAGIAAGQVGSKLGGALGGAAAGGLVGGLLGVVSSKMQGGSWKDAGKAGLKGAAMGAAAGAIGNLAAQGVKAGFDAMGGGQQGQINLPAADREANLAATQNAAAGWATASPEERLQIEKITGMTPQQLQAAIPDSPAISQTVGGSDFSQAEINAPIPVDAKVQQLASQEAAKYGRSTPSPEDMRAAQMLFKGQQVRENIDQTLTVRMWALHESIGKPRGGVQLTEAGIRRVFQLSEGPLDWMKTKAKNLTTKVTADKLQQAWKKAGSPTDSEQLAQVLQQAGLSTDAVASVYKTAGIPAATGVDPIADPTGKIDPKMDQQAAVWKNARNPNAPAATSPQAAAPEPGQAQPAVSTEPPTPETPTGTFADLVTTPNQDTTAPVDATANAEPSTQQSAPVASTTQTAPAPADKFIQQLIASYNALTPEEQSALRKEAELAYDTASNANIVKGTNESLKRQFKKLTNENIQWWLTSKSGRMSSKRLREAAIFELKQRGIIFEAHNERKRN
jgi:hypothetical protein